MVQIPETEELEKMIADSLDIPRLSEAIKTHRGDHDYRTIAKAIGVSSSEVIRLENGQIPNAGTFLGICNWLEIPPATFIKPDAPALDDALLKIDTESQAGDRFDMRVRKDLLGILQEIQRHADHA